MKLIQLILIILLFFLSLIPRSTEVLSDNYLFGFDQGRDYLAVKNIVVNHKLTLIGSEIGAGSAGFKGIFQGPFHYYFLAIPFFIFNGNPYGGMLLMLFFSLASITFTFYFARKLFGASGGFITAILIAICPPLISQARFIWNSHPSTLFILLSFYFLYLSFKNKKFIFLASFFAGFIYNFEIAVAVPVSLAIVIYSLIFLKFRDLKSCLMLVSGFILAFSPMALFELKHNSIGLRGIYEYIFVHKEVSVSPQALNILLKEHFDVFVYNFFDTFPNTIIPRFILIFSVFIPLFYYLRNEKDKYLKKFIIFLLILIPVNFLVFAFLRNAVYIYYLIDLNLTYLFFFSYSFWSSFKNNNNFLKIFLSIILIILISTAAFNAVKVFNYDVRDYGGDAKIKGRIDAIDYIYKNAKGKKFNLFVFSPPVYTYPYDYLVWWYGQKKYGYNPGTEKKGLFYLLIEKDPSKPWSYEGWLETVIKTGKVVETKQLPSGFIIQKRLEEKNEI